MLKAVFIDVDGTITEGNKSAWRIIDMGLGVSEEAHQKVLKDFTDGTMSKEDAVLAIVDLWRSSGKATRKNMIEALEQNTEVREGAYEFVNNMMKKGIKVILLTGTPDINLGLIIKNMPGVEAHTSTFFKFNENEELVYFEYPQNEANVKVDYFREYIKTNNLDPKDCAMIGNGTNDLGVVGLVGFSAAPTNGSHEKMLAAVDYVFDNYKNLEEKMEFLIKKREGV
jgi:HAD superfamily phosphoserine phosphatase-like hydrolase